MTHIDSKAWLLIIAWLLPLCGFVIEVFAGYWSHRCPGGRYKSRTAAYLAVGCIGGGFLLSLSALISGISDWGLLEHQTSHSQAAPLESDNPDAHATAHFTVANVPHGEDADTGETGHGGGQKYVSGEIYTLGTFGKLRIAIDYYVDSLTLIMFTMVTLIATCIHVFAIGYMDDERTEDHTDHQVHLADGSHLHRPGRFYLFFSYMSLFCFSMLGLVLAGNIFMVFVFWELVGICSYLLIGFYVERRSASTAANKAFIVNRVGDFGFIIGLMILWTSFGTFGFKSYTDGNDGAHPEPGLFEMVRDDHGKVDVEKTDHGSIVRIQDHDDKSASIPYWLLVAAGLGIFAGCVGKSAQFPLQTWLPDAMEGPTPVSALVHSATMVAAGVYLAARFFPVFLPEVLLTIAYVGAITLFVAATIAIVATDIKRVLAYSTISQLGYMMLAIGLGGWGAGLFHLITHAFFKSLMFLCSGSVIVGCHHEQEMPRMGGLRKKMPITACTMLIGVIAICGLAVPGVSLWGYKIAFSGYHSKDAIVATAMTYAHLNPAHSLLFLAPLVTAGITAFYMFRLWFYTFAGEPRDQELYDHCHESPRVMTVPLMILAFFAIFCAVGGEGGPLYTAISHSETIPEHIADSAITLPSHKQIAGYHQQAGILALLVAAVGTLLAWLMYGVGRPDPGIIRRQFAGTHEFLVEKWRFDELYDAMFIRPVHVVAAWFSSFDRRVLDGVLHWFAHTGVVLARWNRWFDESLVDGIVNWIAVRVQAIGQSLSVVQTGRLRQYVMFIALGVVTLFLLMFALFPQT
ncbi:MAG: NADH-quinone oxidoreductase subunit L [Planctomycetaceae bacterium]|nr:NADH-quinone oxidoreductase subunit L [Planctomycetaceae bacterium]